MAGQALPNLPPYRGSPRVYEAVKVATPDLFVPLTETPTSIDAMADMIFQDIGGQEIITVSRNDLVNGQNASYQLISNLRDISLEYSSYTIIPNQNGSDSIFDNNPIRFNAHLIEPGEGTGPNGETVYVDDETGNLIVNVKNLASDERVEIEVFTSVAVRADTVYTDI
jgi:hypothetical protein